VLTGLAFWLISKPAPNFQKKVLQKVTRKSASSKGHSYTLDKPASDVESAEKAS